MSLYGTRQYLLSGSLWADPPRVKVTGGSRYELEQVGLPMSRSLLEYLLELP